MDPIFPISPLRSNAVTVVCCGDERFLPITSVLIHSITRYAAMDRFYDLIYLHNGISPENRERFLSTVGDSENVSLRCFDISEVFHGNGLYFQNRPVFSHMAYARLMIPFVLSEDYRRVLYLDGDMIAMDDIGVLFDADLQGQPLGAIRDYGFAGMVRTGGAEGAHLREYVPRMLGFSELDQYINSGLLLMDLDLWRRDYPLSRLMETASSQNWESHDQDVINRVFHGHIRYLEPCWGVYDILNLSGLLPPNMQSEYEKALKAPKLFHFASQYPKSWQTFASAYALLFWANAAQTPFYGVLYRDFLHSLQDSGVIPELFGILNENGTALPPEGSWTRDWVTDKHRRMLLFLLMQKQPEAKAPKTGLKLSLPPDDKGGLFSRIYGGPSRFSGIKKLLRSLLPPLRGTVRNDMQILTDCIAEQERQLQDIFRCLEAQTSYYTLFSPAQEPEAAAREKTRSIRPASVNYYRDTLKPVYAALDRQAIQIRALQKHIEELQNEEHKNYGDRSHL